MTKANDTAWLRPTGESAPEKKQERRRLPPIGLQGSRMNTGSEVRGSNCTDWDCLLAPAELLLLRSPQTVKPS